MRHCATPPFFLLLGPAMGLLALPQSARQVGLRVERFTKISQTSGGFTGSLSGDLFGQSLSSYPDMDGNGVRELIVGANADDDGGTDRGAIWLLLLERDGSVKAHRKVSSLEGSFTGFLNDHSFFGSSVADLGDLDGDGIHEIAVGAFGDTGGQGPLSPFGAVWILFMKADGTVRSHRKIGPNAGGFVGQIDPVDNFGVGVIGLGDLDGDGVRDLAVGASRDDDGATDAGAVWILFLNIDGSVKAHQKVSATQGNFQGVLPPFSLFGSSITVPGDVDGDGHVDLVVGEANGPSTFEGAVWVLFLTSTGQVKGHQRIGRSAGGFSGHLDDFDLFALVGATGDLNGDGLGDLVVGAQGDDDGGADTGAAWLLLLEADGTVRRHGKISALFGGSDGVLHLDDGFGDVSKTSVGDIDGDGFIDLALGAPGDDDGGLDNGAVWILFLSPGRHERHPGPPEFR